MEKSLIVFACLLVAVSASSQWKHIDRIAGGRQALDVEEHGSFFVQTIEVKPGFRLEFEVLNPDELPGGRVSIIYERGNLYLLLDWKLQKVLRATKC